MTPEEIDQFFDDMRDDLGFRTDVQLAQYLGVDPVTLYRWRNGQLDTTKQRLITYFWKHRTTPTEV